MTATATRSRASDRVTAISPTRSVARRGGPRSATSATLGAYSRRGYASRYYGGSYGAYYSPYRHYRNSIGWRGHYLSLNFALGYAPSWCRWGLYSYPFYYSACYPSWYFGFRRGFGLAWNSCYPWFGGNYWWPSNFYQPSVFNSYHYYGDDGGTFYSGGAGSSVVVIDEDPAPAGDEVIVAGDGPASRAAAASRADLAAHHVSLGDFYFKEERFDEAAESYLRALAYAPEDATIHFVVADALFATGDYHYAAFMIGKGLRLDPELATAIADKRTFYTNPEVFESQLATLVTYTEEKPYDAAAHLVLGYNYRFSGRPEEARKAWQRTLEIEPSQVDAQAFLEGLDALASEKPTSKPSGKSEGLE